MSTDTTKETTNQSDLIKKIREQGPVFSLMFVAVIWLNNRLATVEQRLYECYGSRSTTEISIPDPIRESSGPVKYEAVIPDSGRGSKKSENKDEL
jgi:hypothetical protein